MKEEDKLSTQIEYAGQRREVTVINESGLYCLIMSSKLPSARKFKRWMKTVTLQKSSVKIAGGTGKLIP